MAICKVDYCLNTTKLLDEQYPGEKMVSVSGYSRKIIRGIEINPRRQGGLYYSEHLFKDVKLTKPRDAFGQTDNRPICKNTRSLQPTEKLRFDGLSGGPVSIGCQIFGVFIGIEYILSEYIIEKLKELNIT